jgi:type II secretory pathway component PulJ
MKTNCQGDRDRAGFTLVELMISTVCLSLVLAMLIGGISALQRGFRASHDFAQAQGEQVRVCDYLQRDCRSALGAVVFDGGKRVVLTLPSESPGLLSLNLPATLIGLLGGGSAPPTKTVTYNFVNGRLTRTADGAPRAIATHLNGFNAEVMGVQLRTTTTFLSTYGARTTGLEADATRAVALITMRTATQ